MLTYRSGIAGMGDLSYSQQSHRVVGRTLDVSNLIQGLRGAIRVDSAGPDLPVS